MSKYSRFYGKDIKHKEKESCQYLQRALAPCQCQIISPVLVVSTYNLWTHYKIVAQHYEENKLNSLNTSVTLLL